MAKAAAARAAVAAGAQPAVFKVISTTPTKSAARQLLEYLGKREGLNGSKEDIEVQTEDGKSLNDAEERAAYLAEFTDEFREPFQNMNFIEVEVGLLHEVTRDDLRDALKTAFGSQPYIYARSGNTVKVFAYTKVKAGAIAKDIQEGREGAGVAGQLEAKMTTAFAKFGIRSTAKITATVGNESKAQYFLQKFMRGNPGLIDHAGDYVKVAKRADVSAKRIFQEWKSTLPTREVRNSFHLLFSARAGTDPQAVTASAKATLDEHAGDHRFAIAYHPETSHVHVHAMVSAVSRTGARLAFRKADLYAWRETFAEKMRENGIEMVATRREDLAATRPFSMAQAAAYERSKADKRYPLQSPGTAQRVEQKRAGVLDSKRLLVNGKAVADRWNISAVLLKTIDAPAKAVEAASRFSSIVVSLEAGKIDQEYSSRISTSGEGAVLEKGSTRFDHKPFEERPHMRAINKLIGDIAMAKTPLEIREKMHVVNKGLDAMRAILPNDEKIRFDEFRGKLNDQFYDRLAEARQKTDNPQGSQQAAERQARQSDVSKKVEREQASGVTPAKPAPSRAAEQAKQKAQATEQQNRRVQRSKDDEYDR